MQRIFVDMDGVLAKWNVNASMEQVQSPGYFRNLEPENNMIQAVNELQRNTNYSVYILSAVFSDMHSTIDKIEWVKRFLPLFPEQRCLFSPNGESKSDFVKQKTGIKRRDDILLDDYTRNLKDWHGIPIKVLNGINNTKSIWTGYHVLTNHPSDLIANDIILLSK